MKNLMSILMLFTALLFTGCEEIEEISGDSAMKIINDCLYGVKIYFDDVYIGRVNTQNEETWSVPSGNHTVKATCSFANDYEEDFNFISGMTTTIRLELQKKSQQAIVLRAVPDQ